MAEDKNNLDINIGVNATQAEQGSARAKKAIGSIGDESRELQRAFRALKSSIDPTFQAQEKYNRSIENYKKLLDKGIISNKEYRAGLRGAKQDLDAQVAAIDKNTEASRRAAAEKIRLNQQSAEKAKQSAREEAEAARAATQAKIAAAREERRIKAALEAQELRAIRLAAQTARQAASEARSGTKRAGSTPRGVDPGSIQTQQSLKQLEAAYQRTYEAAANHARKASEAAAAAAEASNERQARSAQARAERESAIAQDYATKAVALARTIASVEGQTRQERVAAEKAAREQEKTAARQAAQVAAQAARAKRDAEREATIATRQAAIETRNLAQAERAQVETLQQLRSSIDPVYASQQRYNETMRLATQLLMQNKLQTGEWTAIQRQAKAQMDVNVRSMGQMNSVYVQLGYQAQDVTASLASGINPLVILAQQGGQTAAALSMMGGRIGSIAAFFAGPWGAAIIGFTMLLGYLWQSLGEGEKATKDIMRAEDRRKMSVKELSDAIREYTRAQEDANNTTLEGKRIALEAAQASREQVIANYNRASAELEAANAEVARLKAIAAGSTLAGPQALAANGAALIVALGKQALAQRELNGLQKDYTEVMAQNTEAAIAMAQARSEAGALGIAEQKELQAVTEKYRGLMREVVGDESKTLALITRQAAERTAIEEKYVKLKEKEAAARRENARDARKEAEAIFRTREQAIGVAGTELRDKGYGVSENNQFGGVRANHPGMGNKAHGMYALDINIPGFGKGNPEASDAVARDRMDKMVRTYQARGFRVLWNGKVYEPGSNGAVYDIRPGANQHKDHAHMEAPKSIVGKSAGSSLGGQLAQEMEAQRKEMHDAAMADLDFKQELARDDLEMVLKIQDEKIAAIKAFYGADSAEAINAGRERIKIERQQQKESLAIRQEGLAQTLEGEQQALQQSQSIANQKLDNERRLNQFLLDSNQITQEEAFRREALMLDKEYQLSMAHEARMYNLKLQFLRDRLALPGLTLAEQRNINGQISDEMLAHEQRVFDINMTFGNRTRDFQFQIMDKMEEKWRNLGQTIEQSLSQAFKNIWTHSGSFWQDMVNLADQMVYQAFIEPMSKAVSNWIISQMKMLFVKKSVDTAATASAVASQGIQTAAATTGAAAQTGAAAAAGASEITTNAAVAAAGAYKSTVVIPFIGPVAAPAAAALALAAVLGFGALISARGGQGEVKQDGQLTQLHKKEMVLPAYIAEPLRQGLANPSGGMFRSAGVAGTSVRNSTTNRSGDVVLNYGPKNTNMTATFDDMLKRDSRTLRRWIQNEVRNGGLDAFRKGRT